MRYFLKKNCKTSPSSGSYTSGPRLVFGGWGLCSQIPAILPTRNAPQRSNFVAHKKVNSDQQNWGLVPSVSGNGTDRIIDYYNKGLSTLMAGSGKSGPKLNIMCLLAYRRSALEIKCFWGFKILILPKCYQNFSQICLNFTQID